MMDLDDELLPRIGMWFAFGGAIFIGLLVFLGSAGLVERQDSAVSGIATLLMISGWLIRRQITLTRRLRALEVRLGLTSSGGAEMHEGVRG